ncbi:uncharacterized protein LOC105798020 [Gossypium raimondii]|uniref:DUF7787 domain-containing protein n=1 Tax=Gossypium raimondii TaxID=29730 RepID=A0A0D2RMX2_GOSRA|nr:uncharacterized protein LOC105798020 [Gossypium raimondii]KJB33219.1 hypothetical protein B456_006G001500 [Gossypium raimondii]
MKSKLSVEDYIQFLSSHKQRPLTVNFLNQIISIHGFKKLTKHKKELSDAVETLDLMDPSRSTLKSSISPNAWLTEKEVIGDLNCLEWQECCVTSIEALNSPLPDQQSIPKPQAKRKRGDTEGADSFSSALLSLQSS